MSSADHEPPTNETGAPIAIRCEQCRRPLRVNRELAGKKITCPACGQTQLVTPEQAVPQSSKTAPSPGTKHQHRQSG
jgi:ribosomal protein S27E